MIIRDQVCIPTLTGDQARGLYIWLPEDYDENSDKRYPVLYMFDGQNVFCDEDASFGKSWGMAEYLYETEAQLIVVGVECNIKGKWRLHEYSPFKTKMKGEGYFRGLGSVYMDWLVDTLKPEIDASFNTLPEREYTYIAGSSMGGLMTLYALTAYNHIFSRGAALSPSIWLTYGKMRQLIDTAEIHPDTWLYMTYGTEELNNHLEGQMAKLFHRMYGAFLDKGVIGCAKLVPGASHCEACWEQEVPSFMQYLKMHGWDDERINAMYFDAYESSDENMNEDQESYEE